VRGRIIVAGFRLALRDFIGALEAHAALPMGRLVPRFLGGLFLALLLYVPVHELAHAAGCVLLGGSVERIELSPFFGGDLLARLTPLVSSATGYAGRLAKFDVGGSDLVFLGTDLAPYLLTVLVGVPLLQALRRAPNPWLLGAAAIVAMAPWMSLTGDYYEIGSILMTRLVATTGADFSSLRSDDMLSLVSSVWRAPVGAGSSNPGPSPAAVAMIVASFVLGVLLASVTYSLGALVSRGIAGGADRGGAG